MDLCNFKTNYDISVNSIAVNVLIFIYKSFNIDLLSCDYLFLALDLSEIISKY